MKNTLPTLLLLIGLASCEYCGPQQELSLTIHFFNDTLKLDSISAIGALDQNIFQEKIINTNSPFRQLELPMSLLADSTTYIFAYQTRTDTLTVFYKRDFAYKDGCGFVVDAHSPESTRKLASTFSKASISYEPYVRNEKPRLGLGEGRGISISVEL